MLEGCRQLYEAAGSGAYKEFFLHKMEAVVRNDGSISIQNQESENHAIHTPGLGKSLFWMYEHSEDEKYKQAIEKQIALVKGRYKEPLLPYMFTGRALYLTQPFYMEYETKCHNKAEYKDIVKFLAKDRKLETVFDLDTAWYLMALADVLGCMSIEIYEHYRFLEENLKRIIRQFAGSKDSLPDRGKPDFAIMLGYAVLKACNQKNLNPEKYGSIGEELIESVIDSRDSMDSKETVGLLLMAYAQLLLFRGQMQPA